MKHDQETTEKIVIIESKLSVINEELSKSKGLNRKTLTIHHMDNMLKLFIDLKKLRRLSPKEKIALKGINMYMNRHKRGNAKKIKQVRSNLKNLNEKKDLGLVFTDDNEGKASE